MSSFNFPVWLAIAALTDFVLLATCLIFSAKARSNCHPAVDNWNTAALISATMFIVFVACYFIARVANIAPWRP